MPFRPSYKICPGNRLGRPRALRIVVCDAQITVLPAR
jgi:hypothetical protein